MERTGTELKVEVDLLDEMESPRSRGHTGCCCWADGSAAGVGSVAEVWDDMVPPPSRDRRPSGYGCFTLGRRGLEKFSMGMASP